MGQPLDECIELPTEETQRHEILERHTVAWVVSEKALEKLSKRGPLTKKAAAEVQEKLLDAWPFRGLKTGRDRREITVKGRKQHYAIYVPKGYIDIKAASESMKNEIADYIVYLTWNDIDYFEFTKHLVPQIKELKIHLGRITTKFDEASDMPVKSYHPPKRRMVLSKN